MTLRRCRVLRSAGLITTGRRWLLLLIFLIGGSVSPARADSPRPRIFDQTGHTLAEPMLGFWTAHGGLPVFGYPISEAFPERNADVAARFVTQYFERNRFEAHPENRAPYHVLLGRLGVETLERQRRPWQGLPKAAPNATRRFPETGHAIAHAPFWNYWASHGLEFDGRRGTSMAESLALWGYPISEPALETNSSGDRVLTQWFERARFEDHGPKGVLLGLLGNELATTRRNTGAFQKVIPAGAVRADLPGKLAFQRGADLWLYRPQNGTIRRLLAGTSDARWSPDGESIAFIRSDGLYVADGEGAGERLVHRQGAIHDPVWAPDGTKIAFERGDLFRDEPDQIEVWVVELALGMGRKVAQGADPAWAPDSKRIAYVTGPRGVYAGPPAQGELRMVNWRGENNWPVVRELPPNLPRRGFPWDDPGRVLSHLPRSPFWDSAGASILFASFVTGAAESEFWIGERADATKGGSTFLHLLPGDFRAIEPAPDRSAALFTLRNESGANWFVARASGGTDELWRWAATERDPGISSILPVWAPDSRAVAYYRSQSAQFSLELRTPNGAATLLPTSVGIDAPSESTPMELDWGRDS